MILIFILSLTNGDQVRLGHHKKLSFLKIYW